MNFLAQLDGISAKARQRQAEHDSIEDWLELDSSKDSDKPANGKKRVSIFSPFPNFELFFKKKYFFKI